MSKVSYDLDTSGGLMPLVRALIKPPDEDSNGSKTKKPQHPYYKRPGKGHNHDSCDACSEGGDLICCDRCPASFHLGCHDPPLEENDIPAGQWLCKECRSSDVEKPPSSRGSRAQSPADSEKRTRSLRNNRTSSSISSKKKSKDEPEPEIVEKAEEKELTPMEVLVKAASIMNPKQFELPREMRIPCLFPGTEKEGVSNGNGGVTVVNVDAWGCVPLPAKHCFVCQRNCKVAPLLQCDYCPLLFHLDCLDPPLTCLPTGRWMCPNHVEQYIDWKMVNSISATERVALWDRFSAPVDQHAIKIDFIRRARNPKPPFRIKIPVGVRGRVVVPDMVKYHYENPPPLMPSRREYVRCRNVLKELKYSGNFDEFDDPSAKKHIICMNLTCPKYTNQGPCPHEPAKLEGVTKKEAAEDLLDICEQKDEQKSLDSSAESTDYSDYDDSYVYPVKRRRISADMEKVERLELRMDDASETKELLAIAQQQLNKLDERLVKLLAWQRLQQLAAGECCAGPWQRAPLSARAENLVLQSIDRTKLSRFGFHHVAMPSELLSRDDHQRIARTVWGVTPSPSPPDSPPSPGRSLSDATVRAALCPVESPAKGSLGDGLGRPIPMRLSRFCIGWDSGCDVVLAERGKCRFTSRLHAIIFYDDISHHFELINYSEWGTRVDGALYACDVNRAASDPLPSDEAEAEARAAAVREIVWKKQPRMPRINCDLTKPDGAECECGVGGAARNTCGAWEGSALLHHGALLQFGCLRFVFSITDSPAFPQELPPEDGIYI